MPTFGLLAPGNDESAPILTAESRQRIREARKWASSWIGRNEEFMVGKTAYARGVRASGLTSKPHNV